MRACTRGFFCRGQSACNGRARHGPGLACACWQVRQRAKMLSPRLLLIALLYVRCVCVAAQARAPSAQQPPHLPARRTGLFCCCTPRERGWIDREARRCAATNMPHRSSSVLHMHDRAPCLHMPLLASAHMHMRAFEHAHKRARARPRAFQTRARRSIHAEAYAHSWPNPRCVRAVQFFQFQSGGGGINLEDLMGGARRHTECRA